MENDETQSIVIRPVAEAVAIRLEEIGAKAAELVENAKAENTRKAYRSDWAHFEAWCKKHQRHSLPAKPETVAFYLADLSRMNKVSTLSRRIATISEAHKAAGFESPTKSSQVRFVLAGIKREKGVAQAHMKPCLTRHLQVMVDHLPDSIMGCRDRALLLLGFAGAMRRSELVGLDVCDLTFSAEGMVVVIRRSKTDQAGVGRSIGIPFGQKRETCPVHAVQNWLEAAQIEEGPVFRAVSRCGYLSESRLTDQVVADVVKRSLKASGNSTRQYAGHSLRAGLITQAAMNGVQERSIQDQSGHKSVLVLRRYIRDGSLFRENAAGKVGL